MSKFEDCDCPTCVVDRHIDEIRNLTEGADNLACAAGRLLVVSEQVRGSDARLSALEKILPSDIRDRSEKYTQEEKRFDALSLSQITIWFEFEDELRAQPERAPHLLTALLWRAEGRA